MLEAMRTRMLELQKENEELKKRPTVSPYDDNYYGPSIW